MFRKTDQSTDDFWQEYEEKIGEKVLARGLGKYIAGWEEFDSKGWVNMWGLIIASPGGFRFHHFPQSHWMDSFSRNREPSKEKIFVVPKEQLVSAQLLKESNWLKKIFGSPSPQLIVNYRDTAGAEKKLLLEADLIHGDLVESLNA